MRDRSAVQLFYVSSCQSTFDGRWPEATNSRSASKTILRSIVQELGKLSTCPFDRTKASFGPSLCSLNGFRELNPASPSNRRNISHPYCRLSSAHSDDPLPSDTQISRSSVCPCEARSLSASSTPARLCCSPLIVTCIPILRSEKFALDYSADGIRAIWAQSRHLHRPA